MADLRFLVEKYFIYVSGEQGWGPNGWRAQIGLRHASGTAGYIRFYEAGIPQPQDTSTGGQIRMHLPMATFPHMVDLLRNEKPLWLVYTDLAGRALFATTDEPVGEGE
jgi:hypothetical protein